VIGWGYERGKAAFISPFYITLAQRKFLTPCIWIFARLGENPYTLGRTQATDFFLSGGSFSPCGAKKNLQKKKKHHAAAGYDEHIPINHSSHIHVTLTRSCNTEPVKTR
jgi:hypothetical protein